MTETVSDQSVVVSSEAPSSVERIVERKTIVYETRVDRTVIKVAGEKIKDQLFTRFGFLRPKPDEVQFVSIEKYYEPYLTISGKYFIDYYRKCAYIVSVDGEVLEVILLNSKFEPAASADPSQKGHKTIRLEGEERLKNEVKASLILDMRGEEVTLERLPSAPSERHPKKILEESGVQEIAGSVDLDTIKSRIVRRPSDISRLVSELFEVDERAVIYTPRFRVVYRNVKTGEERPIEFDGVTAERIQQSRHIEPHNVSSVPPPPPPQ